jgi:hypothetical protein
MGFDAMMEADMTDPLSSMYGMLRPYSELTLLRTAFEKYVKVSITYGNMESYTMKTQK